MGYQEIQETPEFEASCGICGFALHQNEIAADLMGTYTDFFTKRHGEVGVVFCAECWHKFVETVDLELRTAIARRRCYENQDKSDRGEFYKSDDSI